MTRGSGTAPVRISDCEGRGFIELDWGEMDCGVTLKLEQASVQGVGYYHRADLPLHKFFAQLAKERKGWKGSRTWRTVGFVLNARHNGRSRVLLEVEIADDLAHLEQRPDGWLMKATINVEPGDLKRIATELRDLSAAHPNQPS